jgi:hypothetical protein
MKILGDLNILLLPLSNAFKTQQNSHSAHFNADHFLVKNQLFKNKK